MKKRKRKWFLLGGLLFLVIIVFAYSKQEKTYTIDLLNLEDIYLKQPDIILVICHNTEEEAKQVLENTIFKNPIYNELEAVKNNGVIYLPKELFHNKPNSKFVLAYETLAQILKGE